MKNVPMTVVVVALAASVVGFLALRQEPPFSQGPIDRRVAALESGHLALQEQIRELQTSLRAPSSGQAAAAAAAAPLPATIGIGGTPVLGRADAKLTIVEFSDFECPFCGRFIRDTFPQLKAEYIDTGKVKYAFRNFPLSRIHPRAMKAAEAGQCAHLQGKFWPMHDRLFANQQALAESDLLVHAQALGVNMPQFQRCLAGESIATIRQDLDEGARGGITGTPGFFIGTTGPDGNLKVLRRIVGAQPYASFKATLDAALTSPQPAG